MRKNILVVALMMAIVALVASVTFAGTNRKANDTSFATITIAAEAANSTGGIPLLDVQNYLDDTALEYVPSDLPNGFVDGATLVIDLDPNGLTDVGDGLTWDVVAALQAGGATELSVCNAAGDLVGTYILGDAQETLVFGPADPGGAPFPGRYINGGEYSLQTSSDSTAAVTSCDGVVPGASLRVVMPSGTGDSPFQVRVTVGGATRDAADSGLIDTELQYSASVDDIDAGPAAPDLLDEEIDFDNDFFQLIPAAGGAADTVDLLIVELDVSDFDYDVDDNTAADGVDILTITLIPSNVVGIESIHIDADRSAVNDYAPGAAALVDECTPDDVDNPTQWVCEFDADSYTVGAANYGFVCEVNVTGDDTLGERSWTANGTLTFGEPAEAKDRSLATPPLFQGINVGNWDFRGTSVYVPLIRNNSSTGLETFFKFQTTDTGAAAGQLRAIVGCDDGTTATVTVGTIIAGTPFAFTGTELEALLPGSCNVNGDAGYSCVLNATSDASELFGMVTSVTPSGAQRRIPLSQNSGVDN